MRTKILALTSVLLLTALASAQQAQQLNIDPNHSAVTFTVRHMGISNVTGKIPAVSGIIAFDANDVTKSTVNTTIKVASIDTGVTMRDNDLRSPNYFDTEKFPEATFRSKRVEKRGDQLVAIGDFTLKGITKEIELPFEMGKIDSPRGSIYGFTAEITVSRKDYDVSGGGMMVGDKVKLEISVEAKPATPPPTPVK
jgi:polyisoprenoid-binding protein YceI